MMTIRQIAEVRYAHLVMTVVGAFSLAVLVVTMWQRDLSNDVWLSLVWTAINGLGAMITLWTWRDTWLEWMAARDEPRPDEAKLKIGGANVRREGMRTVVLLVLCYIGLSVLIGTSNRTISILLLIYVAISLTSNSVLDRIERHETGRILRRDIDAQHRSALERIEATGQDSNERIRDVQGKGDEYG